MEMPVAAINALAEEMPHIEAAELLGMAQAVSLGSGTMQRAEANKLARDWARLARSNNEVEKRAVSPEVHAAKLASMGIRVEGL